MSSISNLYGLFEVKDFFDYTLANFVDISDIPSCACVCKLWSEHAANDTLWKCLFVNKGIPMVSAEAGERDYRSDFRILYPATVVSGELFRKIFGEPIGTVPCIRAEIFDKLFNPASTTCGPFYYQKGSIELVVEYPFVDRLLDKSTPLQLVDGNLVDADIEEGFVEQGLTRIPFSLSNRIKLCEHPLTGKPSVPVFGSLSNHYVLGCDYSPAKVNVYYQRKDAYDQKTLSVNSYQEHKQYLEDRGEQVLPAGPRVLSSAVKTVLGGVVPPEACIWARTSSFIRKDKAVGHVVIGDAKQVGEQGGLFFGGALQNLSFGVFVGGYAHVPAKHG